MSEYLQQSWQKLFGADKFELKLQAMPSSQRGDLMRSWKTKPNSYEISWGGWVSTDLMPWNAFKYWTTYYSAKNEPYLSEDFDKVFDDANFGEDRFEDGVRLKEVAEMEKSPAKTRTLYIPISPRCYHLIVDFLCLRITDKYCSKHIHLCISQFF